MAVASGAGLLLGSAGLYGPNPALGVTEAEAGLLLPGFLGQDAFNLLVGVPLLLGSLWLARRGSLVGLLFLPGTLFYALYWYVLYLTGAPFSVLFLVYVPLVTLSAFTIIGVVSSTDGEEVRRRLSASVPARAIGALLVVLGLLTLAQDTTGALVTALADDAPADPAARPVWISDLALQAPAVIVGGAAMASSAAWVCGRGGAAAAVRPQRRRIRGRHGARIRPDRLATRRLHERRAHPLRGRRLRAPGVLHPRPPRRTGWRNGRDEGAPEGDAMPVKHAPTLAYALSALLAGLLAFSSVAGVLYGSRGL
jgi:hypothetical protein